MDNLKSLSHDGSSVTLIHTRYVAFYWGDCKRKDIYVLDVSCICSDLEYFKYIYITPRFVFSKAWTIWLYISYFAIKFWIPQITTIIFFFFSFSLDFGYCSPFDNKVDDCINGQCVVYPDQYGSYQSTCKCKDGFYGEKCDGG